MFEGLSYELELRRLQREKKKLRKDYGKLHDEAKKQKKNWQELEAIHHEEMFDVNYVDDKILNLQSAYLHKEAERYSIPQPPFQAKDGAWEESKVTGRWRMTLDAMSELRAAIRPEKKERREHWQSFLVLIIGVVGALTGLFSVLISK